MTISEFFWNLSISDDRHSGSSQDCWDWGDQAHEKILIYGRRMAVRRAVYMTYANRGVISGPLSKAERVSSFCGNRNCVNPRHMSRGGMPVKAKERRAILSGRSR